ncbi:MAG: PEP-CTERM sorting domain-containing protein [Nitrospinae bacterium]|nr:PEP-CTERM sorting domain-containing protein [Nitrospinota bacterium]
MSAGGSPPGGVIPEPGTLSLLGIGLAGLALHQWRRKKGSLQ